MKILFIEPSTAKPGYYYTRSKGTFGHSKSNFVRPPIDLMVLAGFLRKKTHAVAIYDANVYQHTHQDVKKKIADNQPDIVVINTSTPTIEGDLRISQIAKELLSDVLTVAIGVHAMALPIETMELNKTLDIAIITEPEIPLANLVESGGHPEGVPGLAWRNGKKIIINKPGCKLNNLDELGLPAHDLVPLGMYHDPPMQRKPMTTTMMSRGCLNACTFCSSSFFRPYRLRSPESVWEELDWIAADLGVREVKFFDSLFNGSLDWVQRFCERLEAKGPDLSWYCSIRADRLTADILKLMRRSGCHTVHVGIESASQIILKNINKDLNLDQVEKSLKWAYEAGMKVVGYFIFGMPGETIDTIRETIRFSKNLKLNMVSYNLGIPHPGTPFYDYLVEEGLLTEAHWDRYDTGNTESIYRLPTISNDDLARMIRTAYKEFYFNPSKILGMLKASSGNIIVLRNYFRNALAIIKNYLI